MDLIVYHAPPLIIAKINFLCQLLRQGKLKYEKISTVIPDKALRRTILSLAQESNQYACELSAQVLTMGGISENQAELEGPEEVEHLLEEKDILGFCEMNERKMVGAYRDILNESYLYEGLRKLIRYQLNGILCSFTQLRLLYSVKFRPA